MNEKYQVPDELLARCVGRTELVQRVVNSFLQQLDQDIPELAGTLASGNTEDARRVAHRIKGASANVAAEDIRAAAENLEHLASDQRLDEARANMHVLQSNCKLFRELTSSFVAG